MQRGLMWRTVALAAAIVACVAVLLSNVVDRGALPWPLSRFKPLGLGLDLQGGSRIVYTIDLDKAVDDRASDIRRDLETRFADDAALKTKPAVRTPAAALGGVNVSVPDDAHRAELEAMIRADYADTTEPRECGPDDARGAICFQVSASYAEGLKKAALANAVNTIRERIDEKGVAEPTVIQKDDQIRRSTYDAAAPAHAAGVSCTGSSIAVCGRSKITSSSRCIASVAMSFTASV
jgi:preprotein translocase subunit SecD